MYLGLTEMNAIFFPTSSPSFSEISSPEFNCVRVGSVFDEGWED